MKHTPGKWVVEPYQWDHGASLVIVQEGHGFFVARIEPIEDLQTEDEPNYDTVVRHPEDEANAKLIAAAPELLEACQKIVNNWGNLHSKDRQHLKLAIKAATE